jgi:hypothetical protein
MIGQAESLYFDFSELHALRWLVAGMAETAGTPACSIKIIDYLELCLYHFGKDHLGDSHAARHGKSFLRMIDHDHLDLAAIVGVDRAGGIEEGDAVFDREAAPRTDLGLETSGKGDDNTGGDQHPVPWLDRDRFLAGGQKIDAACALGLTLRKR